MNDTTSAVTALPVQTRRAVVATDVFADADSFEHAQRIAKVLASSKLVPPHFQGNIADCLIALQIARRLNEEPMTVLQQLYMINGKPGWSTAYMISRVNRSGIFKSPITWVEAGNGDALTVTAKAILAGTGEEIRVSADMRMAAAEGWTKNPKYKSMPTHMLRWRSAAMMIRLYAPEVMLGMPVVEELETQPSMRDVTPAGVRIETLKEALDHFAANEPPHDPDTGEITTEVAPAGARIETQQEAPNNAPAAGPPASESNHSQGAGPGAGEAAGKQEPENAALAQRVGRRAARLDDVR